MESPSSKPTSNPQVKQLVTRRDSNLLAKTKVQGMKYYQYIEISEKFCE